MADIIDTLSGIAPGSPLDAIREGRPQARQHAQATYDSLFKPLSDADASPRERFAIACFVAGLHKQPDIAAFYEKGLDSDETLATAIRTAAAAARTEGPYGRYPKGPLNAEDKPGPVHRVAGPTREALGARLAAAFEHTHMLVFHPRDSAPSALQALLDAGWSTTGIVVISQLVAFLSYQIRVVAGLRVLKERPA
jgi:CMD domain protein